MNATSRYALALAAAALAALAGMTGTCRAAGPADPFDTASLHAPGPGGSVSGTLRAPCAPVPGKEPLALAQVVDQALCNNPQTRLAWANAKAQAALVGVAQAAYLPTLSATASRSRVDSRTTGASSNYNQTSASLSAEYLLYDFGGRAAGLESARQTMAALAATQDATLQSVFLAAVQAYYQWHAAEAAVAAAQESERAANESLKAADARYRIGAGTPADRLQAQTAASQAQLSRIQAEGNARTALGVLANAMGRDAQDAPAVRPPVDVAPEAAFEGRLADLIAEAKQGRPDLAAAEAQVKAARAGIDAARAAGMPSFSLFASRGYNDGQTDPIHSTTVGVSVSIPLFSGFDTTYRVRAAEAQLEARAAQRDQLSKQVSLDVWRAYYALLTGTESVRASADLLAAAEQNEKVASGRYKAGAGGILDLLNAQSALASARQQNIQALYAWHIAKTALAQAIGRLDFAQLESAPERPLP